MSDIAKLESMYQKEKELYQIHKEKADKLRQKIEEEKGQVILKSIKNLNLSPDEFISFQKALADEGNVRELIEKIEKMKEEKKAETKGGEKSDGEGNRQGDAEKED